MMVIVFLDYKCEHAFDHIYQKCQQFWAQMYIVFQNYSTPIANQVYWQTLQTFSSSHLQIRYTSKGI